MISGSERLANLTQKMRKIKAEFCKNLMRTAYFGYTADVLSALMRWLGAKIKFPFEFIKPTIWY